MINKKPSRHRDGFLIHSSIPYSDTILLYESGVDFQDMILTVELEQATFVIVFQMIEIYQGPSVSPTYSFALHSIYLAEQDITAD